MGWLRKNNQQNSGLRYEALPAFIKRMNVHRKKLSSSTESEVVVLLRRGPQRPSARALDWRPTGRGYEPRLSLRHVSQIFHLIAQETPIPI